MSDNSLASLLQWMADPTSNVLWGWGSMAALERSTTNRLLAQLYIARFDAGSYLPPINGVVASVENLFEQHLHDFLLDAPRLSFENAGMDRSIARLSMAVVGGVQVAMEKTATLWRAVAVHDIDPLQGPQLHLNLDLAWVPGTVGQDSEVKLDLKHSDDFILTFAETEHERKLGGDFFKDLFNQLPDEQRVFVLGRIEPGGHPDLRPQSFKLRTMSKSAQSREPQAADDGDGAILILMRMSGAGEGSIPGPSLRYLIPDDGGQPYSATVIFERQLMLRRMKLVEAVLEHATTLFSGAQFTTTPGPNGVLTSAVATGGQLKFDSAMLGIGPFIQGNAAFHLRMFFSGMNVAANSRVPFSIQRDSSDPSRVRVRWEAECESRRIDEVVPDRHYGYTRNIADRRYTIRLDMTYQVVSENGDLLLRPASFAADEDYVQTDTAENAHSDIDIDRSNPLPYWQLAVQMSQFIQVVASPAVKVSVQRVLEQHMAVALPVGDLLREHIQLNFAQAIVPDELKVPRDIGAFGHINPTLTRFTLDPLQPLVRAGGSQQITASRSIAGLVWAVEALGQVFDHALDHGSVDQNGLYRAPSAAAFSGRFLRVRVTASDPATGYRSAVLVTVLRSQLTVNPLIQLCHVGETVELAAGQLGAGERRWSILDPKPGSGTLRPSDNAEGDHTYVAVSQADKPRGQTYVVDTLEVSNPVSGQAVTAQVLVTLYTPELSVRLVDAGLPAGQVQLQAWAYGEPFDEVRWYLPLGGPGRIDAASGVYSSDAAALERFVLILTEARDFPDAGGHIILPLPLKDFPAEQALMTRDSARP